jgi:serine/threonine protein kinase
LGLPEQATGEGVDGHSDVFSLGVVLFQSLTELRLFVCALPKSEAQNTGGETINTCDFEKTMLPDTLPVPLTCPS